MTLGHQLAAMDILGKSEPNGIVVERKWTTVYKTKATVVTGGGGKDEKKIKKKSEEKENTGQYSGNRRVVAGGRSGD